MQLADAEKFSQLLTEIAECFDRKPPTTAALKHWFDTLKSYPWHKVEAELRVWLKTKTRFPTIADIDQPLNDKAIDERETKWEVEKEQEKRQVLTLVRTADGKKILDELKKVLSRPQQDSKAWAHKILDRHADDDAVPDYSLKCACEALRLDYIAIRSMKRAAA